MSDGYVCGKINTHPDLTPYAKVNFSWIVDLNLGKIIKFPEESVENSSVISLFGNSGYKSYDFKNLLIGYIKINICLSKNTKKKKRVKEKASGEKCNIYKWWGTYIYKNKYVFIHISLPTKKEKCVCMANKHYKKLFNVLKIQRKTKQIIGSYQLLLSWHPDGKRKKTACAKLYNMQWSTLNCIPEGDPLLFSGALSLCSLSPAHCPVSSGGFSV